MISANIGFDETEDSDDEIKEIFKEEADEIIAELGQILQELEGNLQDTGLAERLVRSMHTIRGSGRSCGLNHIADFAHVMEAFFDLVVEGKLVMPEAAVNLTRQARDQFQAILDACYEGGTADPAKSQALAEAFKQLAPGLILP
jgi:two-component system chemotaxis sensor kinase CheA